MFTFGKRWISFFVSLAFCIGILGHYAVPIQAATAITAPSVSIGNGFMVALTADGNAFAWGRNQSGQLGTGSTDSYQKTPVKVSGTHIFTAISAGNAHVLALDTNGAVWAWGENESGQLGLAHTNDTATPTQVTFPTGVRIIAIAAGGHTSFALSTTGKVFAWGSNQNGMLGNGESGVGLSVDTPTAITALNSVYVTKLFAGETTVAAVAADGTAWLWGSNKNHQAAASGEQYVTTPTAKSGVLTDTVALGSTHTAFLYSNQTVHSFGVNANGVFGNDAINASLSVDDMTAASFTDSTVRIQSIAAGSSHMVALSTAGKVYTWGLGEDCQLGYAVEGEVVAQKKPTEVTSLTLEDENTPVAVAAGYTNTAVIDSAGFVYVWGSNNYGQVGNNTVSGDGQDEPAIVSAGAQGGTALCLGVAPDEIRKDVYISATATIPAPTYQITIPATLNLGQLTQKDPSEADATRISRSEITVTAGSVGNLFAEKRIAVYVGSGDGNFLLMDGSYTLPYAVYNAGGTSLSNGDLFASFVANGSSTGEVRIDQGLITRSGNYSDTLTFRVAVEDLP